MNSEPRTCRTCDEALPLPANGRWKTYCTIKCKRRDQRAGLEHTVTCATCEQEFCTRRSATKYCSAACREPGISKRCTRDRCNEPHRARGLCAIHWKQAYGKRAKALVPCAVCAAETEKDADTKRRSVCSPDCRRFLQYGYWPACVIPDTHPVLSTPIPADHPARARLQTDWTAKVYRIYIPDCDWCGKAFVTQQPVHLYCTKLCAKRRGRAARRGREHASPGKYTWTEVISLFLKFDRCCAYCRQPIEGQPDPDHVVPLSRGGRNSITNILPSCHRCNGDKRDLLVGEWTPDRARRGLPPLPGVDWHRGDPLYSHLALTDTELARTA